MQIVTADGQIRTANAKTNSDLFWACRGGGGGIFGVNTSFTLATFEARPVTALAVALAFAAAVADALAVALAVAVTPLGAELAVAAAR